MNDKGVKRAINWAERDVPGFFYVLFPSSPCVRREHVKAVSPRAHDHADEKKSIDSIH